VIFEHRVYLPSIGFFIALIAAIGAGIERWGSRAVYAKKAVVYTMILVLLALSGAAYARNTVWKDSVSLWENAVEGSPNKARPRHNLGLAYAKQGRTDKAINEFEIAVRFKPDYVDAHYDLGVAYVAQGRIDEAINEYQTVIKLAPDYAQAHNNLALAYIDQGKTDDAIKEFQTLLKISPDNYPMARKFLEFLLKK
jgi:tetratricopeptide (TPR) repeat protein